MEKTTISERINQIIIERKISKSEFAEAMGITRNYIYKITGPENKNSIKSVSNTLAKLIEKEYGYPAEWVLTGELPHGQLSKELALKIMTLDNETLILINDYINSLKTT
ncbi:MAG: helix-turn-helix domain-containing protein [Clostridiales bacterium]|jgi:transcriptional regulator with XRE-family HTH domain|nr:helix-turn-helix domain-containing protein [Clostridiales bacterium]